MALLDHSHVRRVLAHPIRFARSLALVSSLGASAAGCYQTHERGSTDGGRADAVVRADAFVAPRDAFRAPRDAFVVPRADGASYCSECDCSVPLTPHCFDLGCCLPGPLAPPDLAV